MQTGWPETACIAQAALKLLILHPQSPKCWDTAMDHRTLELAPGYCVDGRKGVGMQSG